MRWTIRAATAADAPSIVALVHRFNIEDGNPPGAMAVEDLRTLACAARPRFHVLVADRDGPILGYTLFYPSYDTEHGAKGCYVQDLYVLPEVRRCGVGRALMAARGACLPGRRRLLPVLERPAAQPGRPRLLSAGLARSPW